MIKGKIVWKIKLRFLRINKFARLGTQTKKNGIFSVVDVVAVLTDSADPNNYWKVLKNRLKKEGSELVTNCNRLKLRSPKDGKNYNTDVLDTKGVLRLVQSIPDVVCSDCLRVNGVLRCVGFTR